jgi:DNA-binding MarR family transcriptional regulator
MVFPFSMATPESRQLTHLLITLTRMLHEQIKRRVSKQPLSSMQVHALSLIDREAPLMRDLARELTITPPSATTLVGGLVRANLVTRVPDAKDHRALHLKLTTRGKQVLKQRLEAVAEGMEHVTNILKPSERKTFIRLMEKVVATRTHHS